MPLPTIPDIWRCAMRMTSSGVSDDMINVVHIYNPSPGDADTIDAHLPLLWAPCFGPTISEIFTWVDTTYTKLDGSAGVIRPWSGSQPADSGAPIGMNSAVCASWRTPLAGRTHRGRSFIGGLTVGSVSPTAPDLLLGTLPPYLTTQTTAMLAGLVTAAVPLYVASYKTSTATAVTSCVINPKVCSMRKRVNGR